MFCFKNDKKHILAWLNSTKVYTRVNKLPAILSRDLARFGPFGEAEIWTHDSFPNLICKNLVHTYIPAYLRTWREAWNSRCLQRMCLLKWNTNIIVTLCSGQFALGGVPLAATRLRTDKICSEAG